jgi:predicted nucleic-acid-binding protein
MSIGVDTNIIIRYIVRDDEEQAAKADSVFTKSDLNNPILINHIVVVETIWVLKILYKYPKSDLIKVLEILLFNTEIKVLNSEEAQKALLMFQNGTADFSDYYLVEIYKLNGTEFTYTFDKKAGKSNNFKLI